MTTANQEQVYKFNVGDRAYFTTYQRHGKITKREKHSFNTTTSWIGLGSSMMQAGAVETTTYERYDFKSDEGYYFSSIRVEQLEEETTKPDFIVPDPIIGGKAELPCTVWQKVQQLPKTITYEEEKAKRARKPENKAAYRRYAEETKTQLAEFTRVFLDWEKSHPDQEVVRGITGETVEEQQLRQLQNIKYKTAPQEKLIVELERQIKADANKWNLGDGVAFRAYGQINRGYRIEQLDRDAKTATLKLVDDSIAEKPTPGKLTPGKTQYSIKFGNLIRDTNYDSTDEERPLEKVSFSTTETAQLVRNHLKQEFPSFKFSVRSDTYSMGSSIDVTWFDGPTYEEVEAICNLYEGAYFDGMQDMKCYKTHVRDGKVWNFGADYVTPTRRYSKQFLEKIAVRVCSEYTDQPIPSTIQGSDEYGYSYPCRTELEKEITDLARQTSDYVKPEATQEAIAPTESKNVEIKHNTERDGIEVRFINGFYAPDDLVNQFTRLGYKWSRRRPKFLYVGYSETTWNKTQAIVQAMQPPVIETEDDTEEEITDGTLNALNSYLEECQRQTEQEAADNAKFDQQIAEENAKQAEEPDPLVGKLAKVYTGTEYRYGIIQKVSRSWDDNPTSANIRFNDHLGDVELNCLAWELAGTEEPIETEPAQPIEPVEDGITRSLSSEDLPVLEYGNYKARVWQATDGYRLSTTHEGYQLMNGYKAAKKPETVTKWAEEFIERCKSRSAPVTVPSTQTLREKAEALETPQSIQPEKTEAPDDLLTTFEQILSLACGKPDEKGNSIASHYAVIKIEEIVVEAIRKLKSSQKATPQPEIETPLAKPEPTTEPEAEPTIAPTPEPEPTPEPQPVEELAIAPTPVQTVEEYNIQPIYKAEKKRKGTQQLTTELLCNQFTLL